MVLQQAPGETSQDEVSRPGGDDATRQLCAAVHADEELADHLIHEYLAERRRAIPPSPGVNPAAVLKEALASRKRRVLRDVVVLALLVIAMIAMTEAVFTWLVCGAVGGAIYFVARKSGSKRTWMTALLIAALVALVLYAVNTYNSPYYGGSHYSGSYDSGSHYGGSYYGSPYSGYGSSSSSTSADPVGGTVGCLALLGIALVLVVDRMRVSSMLRDRFRFRGYRDQPPAPPKLSTNAWYSRRLELVERSSHDGNLRVHDGYYPFVGAGEKVRAWSIAIPLDPSSDDRAPSKLTPSAVYEAARAEVLEMAESETLSPGARLRGLRDSKEAITSATALLQHLDEPFGRKILPNPSLPTVSRLEPDDMDDVVHQSPEWLRPYLCFRVETWNKEMVVSTYLHVGCDDTMLYLEWNAFHLMPIKQEYRYDRMPLRNASNAFVRGLRDALVLPATVGRRIALVARAARDNVMQGSAFSAVGSYNAPARYGARRSLREIVASEEPDTYLQDLDGVRYVTLLERRVLSAVHHCLRDHGIATEEFTGKARTVMYSTVVNGGSFHGTTTIGQGNHVSVTP